ncbi:MAG: hypothetical protein ACOH2F_08665 [Cellulomonas sp.]
MDSIAAITGRIAVIQQTIASLAPERSPAATSVTATSRATSGTTSSGTSAGTASFASVLATEVAGTSTSATGAVSAEPLANAASIIRAGQAMGLSVRDQTIGVMTALGESSLRVVDHGDVAGPDSRGLFQQRDNGAWGSLADRMNPTVSATSFFTALARVPGRDAMTPTAVAHAVQRNADPDHYTKYWDTAVAIVSRVSAGAA